MCIMWYIYYFIYLLESTCMMINHYKSQHIIIFLDMIPWRNHWLHPRCNDYATYRTQLRCGYKVTDLFRQLQLLRFQLLLTLYLGVLEGPKMMGPWKRLVTGPFKDGHFLGINSLDFSGVYILRCKSQVWPPPCNSDK